ncbi:WPP domain-interacting tail-anchored protein 2 isoform X2 [Argentina anserina]|uniref:WPP domain-interacting tail-anchored protein 2 isoform X2 n=1 Tax=Argentina anserina TaxID=57926 RepID=UPI002176575E|nr:WPP domain-interacting tail-anchored protein 2 isoform X2 [Potentilla anserina]
MEEQAVCDVSVSSPEFVISNIDQGVSSNESGAQDLASSMKVLTKVDLDLAYSAEKLANLQALMMRLFSQENDLEAMATANNYILADFHEKVLIFNLLSSILDSEAREMDSFMDTLQAEIVDARHTIFSCSHLGEPHTAMEEKLYDSEESLKQCQEQVSEVKMLAAKFRRTAIAFAHGNWKADIDMDSSEDGQLSNSYAKYNMQMPRQQRNNLRMLEKSLSREIDLEKKLTQSRQTEVQLQLKLHYTEQVAVRMEEAAEGIWGRFLEAENAAEVLQGISKDLLGRLQLLNFNVNGSIHRESELKSKLQDCLFELQAKDAALQKLEHISAENITKDAEILTLKEKVLFHEKQLKESELQLKNANATNESSLEKLREQETLIESMKESIYREEVKAESALLKVAELTGTNVELTEEMSFLKGSVSNAEKKVGILEKQLRDVEIQLQNAKASSEASQEQQNMLYAAIWDMETLIEDLKSKVSKAENKTEASEEQCIMLSESNIELNAEIIDLRARVEYLQSSLDRSDNAKLESAKEVNTRIKFIMDMAMQLAIERERIQKQLHVLAMEKQLLVEKLWDAKNIAPVTGCNNEDSDNKELPFLKKDVSNATSIQTSAEVVTESLDKSSQAGG